MSCWAVLVLVLVLVLGGPLLWRHLRDDVLHEIILPALQPRRRGQHQPNSHAKDQTRRRAFFLFCFCMPGSLSASPRFPSEEKRGRPERSRHRLILTPRPHRQLRETPGQSSAGIPGRCWDAKSGGGGGPGARGCSSGGTRSPVRAVCARTRRAARRAARRRTPLCRSASRHPGRAVRRRRRRGRSGVCSSAPGWLGSRVRHTEACTRRRTRRVLGIAGRGPARWFLGRGREV